MAFAVGNHVFIKETPDHVERLITPYGVISAPTNIAKTWEVTLFNPALLASAGHGQAFVDVITLHENKLSLRTEFSAQSAITTMPLPGKNNNVQHVAKLDSMGKITTSKVDAGAKLIR